jgi:class 3 adenylate cyclase
MAGDGLMAVFGAPMPHPDHCARAVEAALEMIEDLKGLNTDRLARGKAELRIGIGIASGVMIAGYTGTQHRATYTCVGDTVNLAARIEAHTKVAGRPILVDANTRKDLPEEIGVEALGPVLFKGKQLPVEIFGVKI